VCEVEEVGALGVVKLECLGEGFDHDLGGTCDVPALQPPVVVDAHAGERGDLLATKARHTPSAVGRQAGLLRWIFARLEVRNSAMSLVVSTLSALLVPDLPGVSGG
jgi:hypothetical protein